VVSETWSILVEGPDRPAEPLGGSGAAIMIAVEAAHGVIPAAAVVVRRDGSAGSEVLLVRRADQGHGTVLPFAGLWVVPGGRIAAADRARCDADDSLAHARHAAARELHEEVGIGLAPGALRYLWRLDTTAPTGERYRVWYFDARLPPGQEPATDGTELVGHRWVEPSVACGEARSGRLAIAPATLETLRRLAAHRGET
jgi:8-oxo-dGTP pyrophosphatase MutT (NUDIX family)